jgi:hypothetical protein
MDITSKLEEFLHHLKEIRHDLDTCERGLNVAQSAAGLNELIRRVQVAVDTKTGTENLHNHFIACLVLLRNKLALDLGLPLRRF